MRKMIVFAAASLLAAATTSPAAIIANFSGGDGTGSVDQYQGMAGSGWANGWVPVQSGGNAQTAGVINTTPLNGGGNYLSVSASNNSATGNGVAVIRRQYENAGEVDVSLPYYIRFDYRPEVAFSGANISQRYSILGSSAGGTATSGSNTWIASVYSGSTGTASEIPSSGLVVGNWGFLNNTTSGSPGINGTAFVDSTIAMVVGTVYHFEILVDPFNKQYKPSVSDGSNTYVSPTFLGFRNQDASAQTASWLHFNLGLTTTSADLGYSVDNISIVPEPSAFVLTWIAVIGFGFLRKSRSG